jgi:hypothetical protein
MMVDQNLLDDCESEHLYEMEEAGAHLQGVKAAVFLLWAQGDGDYHGTRVPGVYATLEAAQKAMLELPNCGKHGRPENEQEACPDEGGCTFFYSYTIEKLEVRS